MLNKNLNRKLKKQKLIYLIVIIICFIGSLTSIFLPYLEKLNVRSSDLELPKLIIGTEYGITTFVLLSIATVFLITAFTDNKFWPFFMSIITLGLVYFTRVFIHFQGMIDHDYDSKTGSGYRMLFTFSIILFVTSTIIWIRCIWLERASTGIRLGQESGS